MQNDSQLLVRRIEAPELLDVLRFVLADRGSRGLASQEQARGFIRDLQATGAAWRGYAVYEKKSLAGAFVAVCLPGGTAIGLPANATIAGIQLDAQISAANATLESLNADGFHYAQSLIEPDDGERRALLCEAGFTVITQLDYLERSTRFPYVDAAEGQITRWVTHSGESHAAFCAIIEQTYASSLDCPEINGLRPIEDILTTHRASGEFDANLWFIAEVGGVPAGCILIGPHPGKSFGEITYMGVAPDFRGRSLGRELVRQGIVACRKAGLERIILVVDQRNLPAKRMYEDSGFKSFAARDALVRIFARARV